MNIAVVGGRGYIGSAVTTQLRDNGHDVVTMDPSLGGADHRSVSILSENLADELAGFDAVVNLVGLSPMKQPGTPGYHELHVTGAENVVNACESNGIETLVQMSALGADPDSGITFLQTKGEGEQTVLDSNIENVTVFRPSVVYDHGHELVEQAKLLAPTRVFPNIRTNVQPIYRQDVAALFAKAVAGETEKEVLEIAGPDTMTMFEFVKELYNARGYTCKPLPLEKVMKTTLPIMEHVPFAPFGTDQVRFLDIANTTGDNQADEYIDVTWYADWLEDEF